MQNLDIINGLINHFTKLPGVGYKTAERYAYRIIDSDEEWVKSFADSMLNVKRCVRMCVKCGNFSVEESCNICKREENCEIICVVKDPKDVIAIEKSGAYRGSYHVLHGVISPLDKKGPGDLNLKSLIVRIRDEGTQEVIIATNPDVEGEATASYIAALIKPSGVKVTRLAQGLSVGTNLEYADETTLGAALRNRTVL